MSQEIVKIEISLPDKIDLFNQITVQMEKLGLGTDVSKLNLGFAASENWPADMKDQPTIAQLTVIAHKLNMNIIISGIDLYPDGM